MDERSAGKHAQEMWNRVASELAAAVPRPSTSASRILIIREEPRRGIVTAQSLAESAFTTVVARAVKPRPELVTVSVPNTPNPRGLPLELVPPATLDPAWLDKEVRQGGAPAVIVSFVGEPTGPPPAGSQWPPLLCFSGNGSTNLGNQIRSGVVAAAVAPRHTNPNVGSKDWYELRYTVVDKGNVEQWMKDLPAVR